MRANLSFLALLSLLGSAYSIQFQYYRGNGCVNPKVGTVRIVPRSDCVDIAFPSESFHVGTSEKDKQLRKSCKIRGYAGTKCTGTNTLEIIGPSDQGTCYITGESMGTIAQVQSVKMICS